MATPLRNRASNQMLYELVEVQSMIPFSGGPVTANFPASSFGVLAQNPASATLCEVMTIYTSRGGKRGRGRIYLPAGSTAAADVSNGVWLAPQTTRTVALATALGNRYLNPLGSLQFRMGVWSRVIGGQTPPFTSDGFVRATALTVRTIVRTQRRRQVGVGR